ncbi:Eukaryotic translation initiation factor 4B3, partial [Cucurbita argyrosperma subsp. sororia]
MDAAALASAMNEVQRLKIQLNMVSESNETRSNLTKSVENLQSDGIKAVEAYNSLSLKLEQSKDQNSWREGKMPERYSNGDDSSNSKWGSSRVFDENRRKKDEGMTARSKSSNPFGEARLREEVLAEKGQDWKKLDEELE